MIYFRSDDDIVFFLTRTGREGKKKPILTPVMNQIGLSSTP